VKDTLSVVANNFAMFMSTIEYSIQPPSVVATWSGDIHIAGSLFLGQSPTGVTITYPIPRNAFFPAIVMYYEIIWLCAECNEEADPIIVKPHPGTNLLQAIEWQTFRTVDGVGMTSLACPPPISTEESTWGKVKSLYSE
jgi:hypothetical protein